MGMKALQEAVKVAQAKVGELNDALRAVAEEDAACDGVKVSVAINGVQGTIPDSKMPVVLAKLTVKATQTM